MKDIKIRYVFQGADGEIFKCIFSLEQIENGLAEKQIEISSEEGLTLISRDVFTGLTDKNDTEIFEGDILHENYHSENDRIIEWSEYSYMLKRLRDGWNRCAGEYESVCPTQNYVGNLKIIGNIHKNLEV